MKTVTIGIAAYNAEKNISNLLKSLFDQQNKNWKLNRVVVHSDCSSDQTVKTVQSLKYRKLSIINNQNRLGFAGSVIKLLNQSKSDVTLLLNDDIKIEDKNLIEKIVNEFETSKNIGLVTARPVPLKPQNFIERSVISTIKAYEDTIYHQNIDDTIYTCDGKVLALSKKLKSKIKFPKDLSNIGNVDSYIYLSNKKLNLKYIHCKQAQVLFRCPTTLKDWIRWTSRNNADKLVVEKVFGQLVKSEFSFPKPKQLLINKLKVAAQSPIESFVAFMVGQYCSLKARSYNSWLSAKWEVVTTTKLL